MTEPFEIEGVAFALVSSSEFYLSIAKPAMQTVLALQAEERYSRFAALVAVLYRTAYSIGEDLGLSDKDGGLLALAATLATCYMEELEGLAKGGAR